MLSTRTFR